MQLILDKLTKRELAFVLRLLNAGTFHFSDVDHSLYFPKLQTPIAKQDAIWLDSEGDSLRKIYEQGHVEPEMRVTGSLFAIDVKKRNIFQVIKEWTTARTPAVSAVIQVRRSPRSFVHAPVILGVPAHRPPVVLNDPADLVNWLVLRAFANHQMARFVACQLQGCGKFGLRARAKLENKFCSDECQRAFHVGRKKDPNFLSAESPKRTSKGILRVTL